MRTSAIAAVTIATLALALGGCSDNPVVTTPSTPGGTGTASAPAAGQVAQCVVGNWRSTGANALARSGGASATLTGGAGVAVAISESGAVTIDFSNMQPTEFAVQVAGAQVRGKFVYGGRATGTIRTGEAASPSASATGSPGVTTGPTPTSPALTPGDTSVTSGTWEPVPPIDWGDVRVTVDLTQPVKGRPFDNVRIAEVIGNGVQQTGGVVDVNPVFGKGGYECRGDTLVITPEAQGSIGWTLARA
ncbi:MAG TPA: hypothetical protein VGJ53_03985 [Micromonosporaceae bacterium]|jgi:hypothetical protein